MKELTISREHILDCCDELMPLILKHYEEVGDFSEDLVPDPAWETYGALEDAGALRTFVIRKNDLVIGYAIYILNAHLHHKGSRMAINDAIYLCPEFRRKGYGAALLNYSEATLVTDGVENIYITVKDKMDFGKLLEAEGYRKVEASYLKKVGNK